MAARKKFRKVKAAERRAYDEAVRRWEADEFASFAILDASARNEAERGCWLFEYDDGRPELVLTLAQVQHRFGIGGRAAPKVGKRELVAFLQRIEGQLPGSLAEEAGALLKAA